MGRASAGEQGMGRDRDHRVQVLFLRCHEVASATEFRVRALICQTEIQRRQAHKSQNPSPPSRLRQGSKGQQPLGTQGCEDDARRPKKTGAYVPLIRPHSFGEAHSPPVIYMARPPSQSMLSTSPNPMRTAAPPQSPSSSVLTCLPPFRAHGP